jgi:hypothetical protein
VINLLISSLFRKLSYGELSNLAISNSGSGTILEAKYPQLIDYANEALTMLYSRFLLHEKELIIEQVAEETRYNLTSKYAVFGGAGSGAEHHYIIDQTEAHFTDDLIRVLEVWGTNGKFILNDANYEYSLFTPKPLLLQVPYPIDGEPMSVIYQARHPVLVDTGEGVLTQDVVLPYYLENAFQKMIASEVFSHLGGQENIMKSQEYLAAYEKDLGLVEDRDLANQTTHTSHNKLEQRGFV